MSRLIDADAFIDEINKRIKEAYKWYDATQSDEVKVRAEQAIATFCEASLTAKRMPTVEERKTGKWIPVSERLPEEKGMYLVTVQDYVLMEQWSGTGWWATRPTAWMPLPEPYKGE